MTDYNAMDNMREVGLMKLKNKMSKPDSYLTQDYQGRVAQGISDRANRDEWRGSFDPNGNQMSSRSKDDND